MSSAGTGDAVGGGVSVLYRLYLRGFRGIQGGGGEVRLNPSPNVYIVTSRKNVKRSRHVVLSPHL